MWQGYIKYLFAFLLAVASCNGWAAKKPIVTASSAKPAAGSTLTTPTTNNKQNDTNPDLFVEGQDYIRLPDNVRDNPDIQQLMAADPNKVQVLFFFSYGCHGCEMFHSPYEKWTARQNKKPNSKVTFYTYPVSFNPQWAMLAKMFFVMQTLDPNGKLNNAIFTAVHKSGLKLWQEPVMKKFFMKNGYTGEQFDTAFTSFNVNRQVKRADELTKAYNIVITPDIVINGPTASYKLDLAKKGNTPERLLRILDYLIKRESKLLPS